ncbi:MAG: hypothetical protein R3D26_22630 [Cyanobacteriota/Melainabacteria group bacterium]
MQDFIKSNLVTSTIDLYRLLLITENEDKAKEVAERVLGNAAR